jgi:TfoX/Sxy family transcriptional regulator of competence genes
MPPTFSKSPPELVERFGELAELVPEATRRPMFGYPSLVVGGHMFASLFADDLVLRLAEADAAELTAQGGTPFEPMPGRRMTGYVVVPRAIRDSDRVEDWVRRSFEHARMLPPKPANKPRRAAVPRG